MEVKRNVWGHSGYLTEQQAGPWKCLAGTISWDKLNTLFTEHIPSFRVWLHISVAVWIHYSKSYWGIEWDNLLHYMNIKFWGRNPIHICINQLSSQVWPWKDISLCPSPPNAIATAGMATPSSQDTCENRAIFLLSSSLLHPRLPPHYHHHYCLETHRKKISKEKTCRMILIRNFTRFLFFF